VDINKKGGENRRRDQGKNQGSFRELWLKTDGCIKKDNSNPAETRLWYCKAKKKKMTMKKTGEYKVQNGKWKKVMRTCEGTKKKVAEAGKSLKPHERKIRN